MSVPEHDPLAAKRLRTRNLAILALLLGFVLAVFAITIIKMKLAWQG